MKLYEIANEYKSVFESITNSGCFDHDIIDNTLSPITKSFEEKAKNVVAYINNINSDIETLKEHQKNIVSRIRLYENEAENYKQYLKINMLKCNIKSLKCPFFQITIKNSIPSLIIEDEMSIPSDYIKIRTLTEIDKQKLKDDLKSGIEIKGAHLYYNNSITIKMN